MFVFWEQGSQNLHSRGTECIDIERIISVFHPLPSGGPETCTHLIGEMSPTEI